MTSSLHRGPALLVGLALLAGCSPAEQDAAPPLADPAQALRLALLDVEAGGVVEIPAGRLDFDRGLSLTVDGVTLRGAGSDVSVLSFAGQRAGAEGLLVSADGVTLEGFAVEDAKGDAVKINECADLVIRDVRTEWTGGPSPDNGAYGLYPVQCEGVLIEDSTAIGASDAGIYVGQSRDIVVRRNRVEYNVAGIEIENSFRADVYENDVSHNTGGILVFDLPDLPVQGGRETRIRGNRVHENNTENFAPEGNIVGTVPAGTGIMVNANDAIEIVDNDIEDHATAAVLVVSYLITGRPVEDADYDPYPEAVHVHGNRIGRSGYDPDSEPLLALREALDGADLPSVLWDGFVAPDAMGPVLCVHGNEGATVAALDAPGGFAAPRFDAAEFDCTLPALEL
ncbi:MAG: parallel beta-helix domain-containing protein [Pseudomonadales bacterium]|jgi:parallel beta-helix repeat protein|nr:parallel beta-helix domain-containing protein [Pseudomonadales bacterium]